MGRQKKRQRVQNAADTLSGNSAWSAGDRAATPQLDAVSTVSDLDSNADADSSRFGDIVVSALPSNWPSFMQPLDIRRGSNSSCHDASSYLRNLEDDEEQNSAAVNRSRCRIGRGGRIVVDRFRNRAPCTATLLYPTMLQTRFAQEQYQKKIATVADAIEASSAISVKPPLLMSPTPCSAISFLSSSRELEIYAMSDSEDESIDLPRSVGLWNSSMISNNGGGACGGRSMTLVV